MARVLRRYRATGADLPFGDPLRAHAVAMEGYFWRFTDPATDRVVIALCGINRTADGERWATVGLAGQPGGFLADAVIDGSGADPTRLGAWAGDGAFCAGPDRVTVDLGPDARLDVRLDGLSGWTRRPFGGSGLAHVIPALNQYWHPHILGGRASGTASLGGEEVCLDGAAVYAEKNWGRGGFPESWWWGQAQGFAREDACVAFAGGDVTFGPLRHCVTAVVVRLGDTIVRLGDPVLSPVRCDVTDTTWSLRGRGPVWSVEIEGEAPLDDATILPVPLPAERRNVPGAIEHLGGRMSVVLRRRGRVVLSDTSAHAGLEHGGLARAAAEIERRRVLTPA